MNCFRLADFCHFVYDLVLPYINTVILVIHENTPNKTKAKLGSSITKEHSFHHSYNLCQIVRNSISLHVNVDIHFQCQLCNINKSST